MNTITNSSMINLLEVIAEAIDSNNSAGIRHEALQLQAELAPVDPVPVPTFECIVYKGLYIIPLREDGLTYFVIKDSLVSPRLIHTGKFRTVDAAQNWVNINSHLVASRQPTVNITA